MMDLERSKTCRGYKFLKNNKTDEIYSEYCALSWFHLQDYIEMHGQQYIKFRNMCLSDTTVPSILPTVHLHAADLFHPYSERLNRMLCTNKLHLSTIDVIQHKVQLVWCLETVMKTH
jgi:hypothetical protein